MLTSLLTRYLVFISQIIQDSIVTEFKSRILVDKQNHFGLHLVRQWHGTLGQLKQAHGEGDNSIRHTKATTRWLRYEEKK